MKKILFYSDSTEFGGAEKILIDLINGVDRKEYCTVCVLPKSRGGSKSSFMLIDTKIYELSRIQLWLKLISILRHEKPDIIHLNMGVPFSCYFAIFSAVATKSPYIVATVHSVVAPASRIGPLRLLKRFLTKILLPKIHKIICVSQNSMKELRAAYGIRKETIDVIYNGINIQRYKAADASLIDGLRKSLGIKSGQIVVGSMGRMVKGKGFEYLLESMAELMLRNSRLVCLVIGDGYGRKELEAKAKALGIMDRVIFTGYINDPSLYLSIIDIYAHPSLHEAFPLSILEAMAAGKPVIATCVGGVPELVDDGVNGFLIPTKDHSAITSAVSAFISDKKKTSLFGRRAAEKAQSFSVQSMVKHYRKMFSGSDRNYSISLILATVGRYVEVKKLMDSLTLQTYKNFEIVVIDQNSNEIIRNLIKQYRTKLKIKYGWSSKGVSKARNKGISIADGELIAFPDDDCWYPSDLLEKVNVFFKNNDRYDGLSTRIVDETGQESVIKFNKNAEQVRKINTWNTFSSITLFLRRDVIDKTGFFNENMGLGCGKSIGAGEDMDYVLRALEKGFKILFDPNYCVCHPQVKDIDRIKNEEKIYRYALSGGLMMRVHKLGVFQMSKILLKNVGSVVLSLASGNFYKAKCTGLSIAGKLKGYFDPSCRKGL